ncbi:hypothetical protein JXA32_12830 [Candidatus Sumerlaeota bacterium]|nr:hypothetical protein [Candidatus Sumerlaeota bacterium]
MLIRKIFAVFERHRNPYRDCEEAAPMALWLCITGRSLTVAVRIENCDNNEERSNGHFTGLRKINTGGMAGLPYAARMQSKRF